MKLYGHPVSTCTRKVLATLHENAIPFELVTIDFATRQHKQEPHLSRQPFGQIPAIDDDGFELYESRAIARYLDEKSGGKLIPKDLQERARMEQWISIESANFSAHAMKFVYHYVFKRPQEDAVLETARTKLALALDVMQARLSQSAYLAGPDFTLADLVFMPYFDYVATTPLTDLLLGHQHVAAWWSRISERPAWRKAAGRA